MDSELELFYKNFYGPAAPAMRRYWSSIYDSFDKTLMIDHEFFVIPSLYPESLVSSLALDLEDASADVEPYRSRLAFTRNAFEVLHNYVKMTKAGATDCDYRLASEFGAKGLEARDRLTEKNPTFTTYQKMPEQGAAWWPGEVAYYESLAQKTDGTTGDLVSKLPLQWSFRMDPQDHGLWRGWGRSEDFSEWSQLTTDKIPRAQGLVQEDFSNPEGFGWYACQVHLTKLESQRRGISSLSRAFQRLVALRERTSCRHERTKRTLVGKRLHLRVGRERRPSPTPGPQHFRRENKIFATSERNLPSTLPLSKG